MAVDIGGRVHSSPCLVHYVVTQKMNTYVYMYVVI